LNPKLDFIIFKPCYISILITVLFKDLFYRYIILYQVLLCNSSSLWQSSHIFHYISVNRCLQNNLSGFSLNNIYFLKFPHTIIQIFIYSQCSSAIDCGFESRSGQTKDYEIGMCCFSAKHALRRKSKTSWLGIRIMCSSGAPCLSADCCFSELAL
jgi:hypothetical protein